MYLDEYLWMSLMKMRLGRLRRFLSSILLEIRLCNEYNDPLLWTRRGCYVTSFLYRDNFRSHFRHL